ncbi:hypothetical protein BS78_10G032300 [Paspalum vaginatum]|nr:hypothetical protein BS78_10G032300 [Paspalum vaginatum]
MPTKRRELWEGVVSNKDAFSCVLASSRPFSFFFLFLSCKVINHATCGWRMENGGRRAWASGGPLERAEARRQPWWWSCAQAERGSGGLARVARLGRGWRDQAKEGERQSARVRDAVRLGGSHGGSVRGRRKGSTVPSGSRREGGDRRGSAATAAGARGGEGAAAGSRSEAEDRRGSAATTGGAKGGEGPLARRERRGRIVSRRRARRRGEAGVTLTCGPQGHTNMLNPFGLG